MDSYWLEYRIIQMVHSGALLQLQRLVEIYGKLSWLCRSCNTLLTSFMKNSLENFRGS